MRGDDLAVAALAESVADGTPVDWQTIEQQGPQVKRLARHLRLVDSIAALHRSMPADEAAPIGRDAQRARGRRWGRLVLLETIGSGTSCDVYRAWDAELHRDVALKLFHDASDSGSTPPRPGALDSRDAGDHAVQTRVLEEARRMARLRHEHVVQVYGAEQHDGRVGLWMELVRGTSLEQLVQQRGSFGANEAALIGLDVCAALAAVHGAGLLHRDVKAQNVMREDGGRIVLMDFGTGEDLAGTNRLVGTPLYLAPEIFAGGRASVQSDVYAVGVLLFYLVTGAFPVTARSMQELADAHRQRSRRSLRDLRPDAPQAFVAVVERALDTDPSRRYRTVGDLESTLRGALVGVSQADGLAVPSRPATGQPAAPPRSRAARVGLIATMAITLALVSLVVWTRNSRPPSPVAPPGVTRVAVLPFENIGPASDRDPSDELTDQLISTLGQIHSIQVTSLRSVLRFKGGTTPLPEIAKLLNVDNVVEGTIVMTDGANGKPSRVRVSARLIAAGTDSQIWARDFERSFGETLALHADMAQAIAEGIRLTLTPAERQRLKSARASTPEANEAYFLGLHYLSQSSANSQRMVEAFRRAITLDPDHADARAGLARGLMGEGVLGAITHAEARALALAEVKRALAIDPESSEANAVMAELLFRYDWDWVGADESYRRAISFNTSAARARSQYARYLAAAGRGEEAVAQATLAVDLEPMSASAVSTKALMQYYQRDYLGALRTIDHAVELEPDAASVHLVRSRIQEARGDLADAIRENERAVVLAGPAAATGWRSNLARLKALAGRKDQARETLRALETDVDFPNGPPRSAHLAYVHDALGDRGTAITLLERAVDDRDPDILWLGVDPRVDSLRKEPRFQQLLGRLGLPR